MKTTLFLSVSIDGLIAHKDGLPLFSGMYQARKPARLPPDPSNIATRSGR